MRGVSFKPQVVLHLRSGCLLSVKPETVNVETSKVIEGTAKQEGFLAATRYLETEAGQLSGPVARKHEMSLTVTP
jgi:hypothetical protein